MKLLGGLYQIVWMGLVLGKGTYIAKACLGPLRPEDYC